MGWLLSHEIDLLAIDLLLLCYQLINHQDVGLCLDYSLLPSCLDQGQFRVVQSFLNEVFVASAIIDKVALPFDTLAEEVL